MRCLAIKRIALFVEAAQPGQRVGNLQQGSIAIVAYTAEYLFRHGPQIDDVACIPQAPAVLRPEHGATAGGENTGKTFRQIMNDRLFDVAESVLALTLEKIANRAAQALLDHVIGIGEWKVQPPGQLAPDSGLAGAGQADEDYARVPGCRPRRYSILQLRFRVNVQPCDP